MSRALIDKNTATHGTGEQFHKIVLRLCTFNARRCTFRNPVAIANLRGLNPSLFRVHSTIVIPTFPPGSRPATHR